MVFNGELWLLVQLLNHKFTVSRSRFATFSKMADSEVYLQHQAQWLQDEAKFVEVLFTILRRKLLRVLDYES